MKVLIDENLPVKLKSHLTDKHEVYTVADKKWNSIENGELLSLMQKENFDFLITADKNIPHQQSIEKFKINLIIIRSSDNRYENVILVIDKIKIALENKDKLIQVLIRENR